MCNNGTKERRGTEHGVSSRQGFDQAVPWYLMPTSVELKVHALSFTYMLHGYKLACHKRLFTLMHPGCIFMTRIECAQREKVQCSGDTSDMFSTTSVPFVSS
jgi:hypothetical protein